MTERKGFGSEDDLASWRRYDEDAIASLMDKLRELDAEENVLVPRLTSIRTEREKTIYWISLLKGEESEEMPKLPFTPDEKANGNSELEDSNVEEEIMCGKATISDLDGCPSQRKAMYIIGEINDGIIELNDAAALVVAAGMSKTGVRTVSATLHNFMSNHNDFEWIGPSRFRLNSEDETELTTGDEMAQAERNSRRVRI